MEFNKDNNKTFKPFIEWSDNFVTVFFREWVFDKIKVI